MHYGKLDIFHTTDSDFNGNLIKSKFISNINDSLDTIPLISFKPVNKNTFPKGEDEFDVLQDVDEPLVDFNHI